MSPVSLFQLIPCARSVSLTSVWLTPALMAALITPVRSSRLTLRRAYPWARPLTTASHHFVSAIARCSSMSMYAGITPDAARYDT
jgi:hypothetical protein